MHRLNPWSRNGQGEKKNFFFFWRAQHQPEQKTLKPPPPLLLGGGQANSVVPGKETEKKKKKKKLCASSYWGSQRAVRRWAGKNKIKILLKVRADPTRKCGSRPEVPSKAKGRDAKKKQKKTEMPDMVRIDRLRALS